MSSAPPRLQRIWNAFELSLRMPENDGGRTELVYLVRLWSERPGTWRASVEDIATHERVYVKAPQEVGDVLALRCDTESPDPPSPSPQRPDFP